MTPTLLITGASRGIGAATALLAAQRGYAVAVNYSANSLAADEVVRQIRAGGGTAMAVQADVADEAQVMAMFAHIDARLGPLTALVNNAGVVDVAARVDEMSVARLKRMFDINVAGQFCLRARGDPAHEHAPWRRRRQHRQPVECGGAAGRAGPVCGLCREQRRH